MKSPERAIVRAYACGIFAEPTFKSEMVNQALMWEEVLVSDKKDNWCKIQLKHDGYSGWIHQMYLTFSEEVFSIKENHSIAIINSNICIQDSRSDLEINLSVGCRVPYTDICSSKSGNHKVNLLLFCYPEFDEIDKAHKEIFEIEHEYSS